MGAQAAPSKDGTGVRRDFSFWSIRCAAAVLFVLTAMQFYLVERPVKIDEAGFLNPVLEYVHHGKVVYPAHGSDHAHSMIIHPPVHYWLVGLLMKAGLDFYPAAVTLPLLAFLVAIIAILTAPWPDLVKLSFLVGIYIPNVVLIDLDPSRPELQMALALVAGWVFLESARLEGWRPSKLFIGSFVLAYASGLHYFAWPAVAGCGVYIVRAVVEMGWRPARPRIRWIVGGAALFGVPYLVLFVIPEHAGIRSLIGALSATENPLGGDSWLKAFQYHRDTYPASLGYMSPPSEPLRSVFLELLKPFLLAGIPVVFVSTPLLLILRQTRFLALASLPFQLGLLFFCLHKSLPYYRAEFSLFYASLGVAAFSGIAWLLRRNTLHRWVSPVITIGIMLVIIADSPVWQIPAGGVFVDELALSRAAGKALVGADAVVAGRSVCLWYTSGGRFYRNVTSDLIYPPDVSSVKPEYFTAFDGVAEEPQGSYVTYNRQKTSLPSWYLNGTLSLEGFYGGRDLHGSQSGYYLVGVRRHAPVQAWFWQGREFFRFAENPTGKSVLLALVSPHAAGAAALGPVGRYLLAIGLPPDSQEFLTFHVVPRMDAEELRLKLAPGSTIRDLIPGDVEKADIPAMLRSVDYHREMTDIFYSTEDLQAAEAKLRAVRN